MISRGNWKLVRKYLTYREEVHQLGKSSVLLEKRWLKHVLEWAGQTPFLKAPKIRPVLPIYIITARQDGSQTPLSPAYVEKIIGSAKRIFSWLRMHESGYRGLKASYLDTLRPPRQEGRSNKFMAVTLDEMLEIAAAPVENIQERRIRAAACFWFLSGIRIGAFVTLPISAVNLREMSVKQWPEIGVRTKNLKKATTYLFDIPEILLPVAEWDSEVKGHINSPQHWFAYISPKTGDLDNPRSKIGVHRDSRARKSLYSWLAKAGFPMLNPHSFRHGHAVYAIQKARNIGDLKAISLNLMHGNLTITDGVYGVLSNPETKRRITSISDSRSNQNLEAIELLSEAMEIIRNQRTK